VCVCVCVCVYACARMCVCKRDRERERESACVCMSVCARACVRVRFASLCARVSVFNYMQFCVIFTKTTNYAFTLSLHTQICTRANCACDAQNRYLWSKKIGEIQMSACVHLYMCVCVFARLCVCVCVRVFMCVKACIQMAESLSDTDTDA